jgi:hypothetical protein
LLAKQISSIEFPQAAQERAEKYPLSYAEFIKAIIAEKNKFYVHVFGTPVK